MRWMRLETREVEIEWNGEKAKVVLKKLTWGEKSAVIKEAMGKITFIGGEAPKIQIDPIALMEGLLLRSIKEAPFKVEREVIRSLPSELVEDLIAVAQELNPFRPIL